MNFGLVYDRTKKSFYDFRRRSIRKAAIRGRGGVILLVKFYLSNFVGQILLLNFGYKMIKLSL